MKDSIKKGQSFIGIDDKKYYFLGFDYNGQILFTSTDLWTDKEQQYIEQSPNFIKSVLDEQSEMFVNCPWYYQSLKELSDSTTEEKIKRCLDIIENSGIDDLTIKPIKIGALVRGQAYSKDLDQYYELIGFIVENNIYVKKSLKAKEKGFFAIYHSNCDNSVPLIFDRKDINDIHEGKRFISGNNDVFNIEEVLMDEEKVKTYLNKTIIDRLEKNAENEMSK